MKRKISALIAAVMILSALTLTGCGNKGSEDGSDSSSQEQVLDTATKEIRQNDYRGGVMRTYALQNSILNVMEDMKQNNIVIRADSPNSFWTAEGYQDFVVNFLSIAIIDDTQWCNEEETDWTTVVTQTSGVSNSFTVPNSDSPTGYAPKYSGLTITRNEKDDYSITGIDGAWESINLADKRRSGTYYGKTEYRILYDCDKDWCKAYATLLLNNDLPLVTTELFEYARIDADTFAVQTSTERLLVILEKAENDTDIRERSIKEFYYSKLVSEGARTTFEHYKPLPEYDEDTGGYLRENALTNERMSTYRFMNEKGDLTTQYGIHDSLFLTDNIAVNVNPDWVYTDKSLQQAIIYKDGALVVTTYNKLSESYERFVYALNGVTDDTIKEIENMVEIKNLVGVQEISETEVQFKPEETTTSTADTDTTATTLTTETTADTQNTIPDETTESPEDEQRRIAGERQNGDVYYE